MFPWVWVHAALQKVECWTNCAPLMFNNWRTNAVDQLPMLNCKALMKQALKHRTTHAPQQFPHRINTKHTQLPGPHGRAGWNKVPHTHSHDGKNYP